MKIKEYQTFIWIFLALIPVMLLRDYTPDNELRYLSIADEALRNGTFFTFSFQGEPYADKPPLYLWIVMLCKAIFGQYHMLFLSLFSLLPAFVTIRTLEHWTARNDSPAWQDTSRWLMMSCGLFLGMAVILRMDMLMTMFITLALHSFWMLYRGEGNLRRQSILFPVWIFMALFSKGPVGVLVPLGASAVFLLMKRELRTFGKYWGWKTWGILLAGCIVWFGMVFIEGGTAYLDNLLFHQTVDRAVNSFHHEEPFYYYFISIWYSLAPWSPLLIGILIEALCRRRFRTDRQKLLLATAAATFVMLSCISSKIAVYLLPAFPFITYLSLSVLPEYGWNRWIKAGIAFPATVWSLALPGLAVANYLNVMPGLGHPLFWTASALLSASGIAALVMLYHKHQCERAIRTVSIGLMAALFTGGWALPAINGEIGYGQLCRRSMEVAAQHHLDEYVVWDIRRPESMDAYLGKDIRKATPDEVADRQMHGIVFMLKAKKLDALPDYFKQGKLYREGKYAIIAIE